MELVTVCALLKMFIVFCIKSCLSHSVNFRNERTHNKIVGYAVLFVITLQNNVEYSNSN